VCVSNNGLAIFGHLCAQILRFYNKKEKNHILRNRAFKQAYLSILHITYSIKFWKMMNVQMSMILLYFPNFGRYVRSSTVGHSSIEAASAI
jgi:hypothetical protein